MFGGLDNKGVPSDDLYLIQFNNEVNQVSML